MAVNMRHTSTRHVITVLLVDSQELVRRGVRTLLEEDGEVKVIGDMPVGWEAVRVAKDARPDVIVLEPDAPCGDENVIDLISGLASDAPHSAVLLLTDVRDPQRCTRFLAIGAVGLVLKHQPADVLLKAVKKLKAGEAWLDRANTARLLKFSSQHQHTENAIDKKMRALTRREREIVAFICEGLRNRELAERLFISEATVRNHVTSILGKLELVDRFELVVFAFRHHLVERSIA
jgi:DNA-binding NarL/FixJ family response regulator